MRYFAPCVRRVDSIAIGFPAWTGGVVQIVDQYDGGTAGCVARCRQLAEAYGERFLPSPGLAALVEAGAPFRPATDANPRGVPTRTFASRIAPDHHRSVQPSGSGGAARGARQRRIGATSVIEAATDRYACEEPEGKPWRTMVGNVIRVPPHRFILPHVIAPSSANAPRHVPLPSRDRSSVRSDRH